MTSSSTQSSPASPPERRVFLENIRWATYEALLEDLGEHRGRLTYDEGTLEIVSPSKKHEQLKALVGRFIEAYTEESGLPVQSVASTTMNRKDLERAVEADECYYVQNEHLVRDKEDLDLRRDPPPDLAVEIEISSRILPRLPIFAALGVPEVWRYDGETFRVMRLEADGQYAEAATSAVFPELAPADVSRFLAKHGTTDETSLVREFRAWVRSREDDTPRG